MSHAAWIGLLAVLGAGAIRGRRAAGAAPGLFLSGAGLILLAGCHFLGWNACFSLMITLALISAVLLALVQAARDKQSPWTAWACEAAVASAAGLTVVIFRARFNGEACASPVFESTVLLLLAGGFATAWATRAVRSGLWCAASLAALAIASPIDGLLTRFDAIAPTAVLALGVLGCAGILSPRFAGWRARRRVWLTEPERLTDPPPNLAPVCVVVTVLALGCGLLALRCLGAPGTAPGLGLAAWAAFSAGYVAGWRFPAELGFALVGLAIATTLAALSGAPSTPGDGWSQPPPGVALAAAAATGILLLALSRSWAQLVRDGEVLTFAGRLAGSACSAAGACAVAVVVWISIHVSAGGDGHSNAPNGGLWPAALTLAWAIAWVRWSASAGSRPPTAGAGLLTTGLAVFAGGGATRAIPDGEPIYWVSLAATAWVFLLLTLGRQRVCGWACQAYIWGLLPVVGLGAALDGGLDRHTVAAMLLMVAAALASCLARDTEDRGRPTAAETRPMGTMTTG